MKQKIAKLPKEADDTPDYVTQLSVKLEQVLAEARALNRRAQLLIEEEKAEKARNSIRDAV